MTHHNHRESRIRHWASCGEYPTLAHFRHFRHFSSLYFTLAHFRHFSLSRTSKSVENPLQINLFMQSKPNFPKKSNELKLITNNGL